MNKRWKTGAYRLSFDSRSEAIQAGQLVHPDPRQVGSSLRNGWCITSRSRCGFKAYYW